MSSTQQDREFQMLYDAAHLAGMKAAEATKPTPMVVGTAVSLFGNEIDVTKPVYHVPDGVCGFAWIVIKPATSAFARWARKNGLARPGYGGGLHIWVSQFGQSMERKFEYATAFAKHLSENGIKAYSDSRMD